LSFRIFRDQDKAAIALQQFAPVEVRIEYLPDWECRSTAGQIAWVVREAHWEIKHENFVANPNEFDFFEGVGIAVNAAGSYSGSSPQS
jgi:hypothetical protein